MKKIVFFDADGTLWYPKKTKYKEKPRWVYLLPGGLKEHKKHFIIIPTVLATLRKLRKMGIVTVLLSTHPFPPKVAAAMIKEKVKHFKVKELFDEVHATRDHYESKGEFMVRILKKRKIPKSQALMVGDNYRWDYRSAKIAGIDAVLIESDYLRNDRYGKNVKQTIKRLSGVFNYIS